MSMAMVCCSHSPLLLGALDPADLKLRDGFFAGIDKAAGWIADFKPDLLVVFAPDHFTGLFYDLMPAYCIGVEATSSKDWDLKPGKLNVAGDVSLGLHKYLNDADFDPAISYNMIVDHGTTIPLMKLTGALDAYPVVPIVMNCAALSRPSMRRSRLFGEAVGRYLKSLDRRVMMIGSGGLSHDPPTPALDMSSPEKVERLVHRHKASKEEFDRRQNRVVEAAKALVEGGGPCLPPSETWDRQFLDTLMNQSLEDFDAYRDDEMSRLAGFGGHEVRTWVAATAAMKAAGPFEMKLDYYEIIPEWITGMGIVRGIAA